MSMEPEVPEKCEKLILMSYKEKLCKATYKVVGGPMDNKLVSVIFGLPDIIRRKESLYTDIVDFERDVVESIGILNCMGRKVTPDVLDHFNRYHSLPDLNFSTKNWTVEEGWR